MAAKRTRVKVGDVLEVRTGDRFAYVQYIGRHPEYGCAVLVSPRLQERQVSVAREVFSGGYVTFYPAPLAVAQRLAEVVAHLPSPSVPQRLRRPGAMSGRRIITWIIEDGSREVVKANLSEEELRLPIAAIWNHEFLIQRIAEGWNPMNEGREIMSDDRQVIQEIAAPSDSDAVHTILHYLYAPTIETAGTVAKVLRQRGFRTDERLGWDGVNWLILARHEAVPTGEVMTSTRHSMEALMDTVGGEYSGWEIELRHRDENAPSRH